MKDIPIIPCTLLPDTKKAISDYVEALTEHAHEIGEHGLDEKQFWDSGLFRSAIERLRGKQAASTAVKRQFMETVLDHLESKRQIKRWRFVGSNERHDYELEMGDGRISIVETKGCLDGNNTNIFERPPQADEFIIWSLCQNPGADPQHNAWSGIHTRLSAEIIHRKQTIDGLVIWDMLCGTIGRPCPKLSKDPKRATELANRSKVPPPCIYLFPRTVPDPRNNPNPESWNVGDVKLLHSLWKSFRGEATDLVQVQIEVRMQESELQRKTHYYRGGKEILASEWTTVKRARR